MKAAKNIFKGLAAGGIAALMALLAIGAVLAYSNPLRHLSIPARPSQPLTIHSSPDDVLGLMLDSDQMWDSLVAEYTLTDTDANTGQKQTQAQRFWLDKKGELARVEIDGSDPVTFVRGAAAIRQEKRNKKVYSDTQIPGTFKYADYNPRKWLADNPSGVYLHPFGKAVTHRLL